jgi:predicted acylesterase/phospholipase RssA/CheY-like chemotaxis protein
MTQTNQELSLLAQEYVAQPAVKALLEHLQNKSYPISDLKCKNPKGGKDLYFVDLVQQGGGVLGVALVGYTYALETAGIRFCSLAGTSAGAINTVLLAGVGAPAEFKSGIILEELVKKQFSDFVDAGWWVIFPMKLLMSDHIIVRFFGGFLLVLFNACNVFCKKGMSSGNAFEKWIEKVLAERGISVMSDLLKRMNELPNNLEIDNGKGSFRIVEPSDGVKSDLGIIAADITTQTKVVFPRMANLYTPSNKKEQLELKPKEMVRASMSIPVFYQPKYFNIPEKSRENTTLWSEIASFLGEIPEKVLMVDGGIMSNFPIDLFHEINKTPRKPTLGVRLGLSRQKYTLIDGIFSLLGSAFNSARNLRDFEFLSKNEDYHNLVQYIDTDEFNWLNFSISKEEKQKLFYLGVKAAYDFLEGTATKPAFNWKNYQTLRRRMLFSSSSDRIESLWTKEDAIRKFGLEEMITLKTKKNKANVVLAKIMHTNSLNDNLNLIEDYIAKEHKVKVLWVDNDPTNDIIELSVLRAFNIEYITALDNEEAINKLKINPDILLIVTDSSRQGNEKEGLVLCKRIMDEEIANIPIILHSISLANKYYGQDLSIKEELIQNFKNEYSDRIVGNFIETRELIVAIVAEIAKQIDNKPNRI